MRTAEKKAAPKKAGAKKGPATKKTSAKKSPAGAKKYGTRADKGAPIDSYVTTLEGPQREVVEAIISLVKGALPEAGSELKWGMPVFTVGGRPFCYVRAFGGYSRFGFYDNSDDLEDPEGLLEGSGQGRHVKVANAAAVDRALFTKWVKVVAKKRAAA